MSAEKDSFAKFLKHFTKGTVLFNEGDEGEEMYIIRSGKVAIKKRVAHGEITVAVLEKGDFFGEMAMLERIPRTAGAEMRRRRRPDRDRQRRLRGHGQVEPRDRRAHAAQVLAAAARDHEADRGARRAAPSGTPVAPKAPARGAPVEAGSTAAGRGGRLLHLQGERQRVPGVQDRLPDRPLRLGDRA